MKEETGDIGKRQIIIQSVKEFGLYTKVSGKPGGERHDLISLLEKHLFGGYKRRVRGTRSGETN